MAFLAICRPPPAELVFRGVWRAAQVVEHSADPGCCDHQCAGAGAAPGRIFRIRLPTHDRRRVSARNLILALVQGVLSGFLATYLFTRAVVLLGASKAAVFPALVPPFTSDDRLSFLGNIPTALQLVGLAMVLTGFWPDAKELIGRDHAP